MYTIRGYASDFYAGRTSDGRQILLGLLCPDLVAYFFSPDGDLLGREVRPWEYPAPRAGENGPFLIYDPEFERRLTAQLAAWQREIGFQPGAVRVRPFFDDERSVGIQTLADYFLDDGDDEDEREEAEDELKAWEGSGAFVFYWAKDYLLSADGTVEST